MNYVRRSLLSIATCTALAAAAVPALAQTAKAGQIPPAQTARAAQTAGVDNDRMGAYRALAQLSYQAFKKGDLVQAAELSRILERTWDQGEWHNQTEGLERSWCRANHAACEGIDKAMDVYIEPIIWYTAKTPDPKAVQAAYNAFLEQLKKAD